MPTPKKHGECYGQDAVRAPEVRELPTGTDSYTGRLGHDSKKGGMSEAKLDLTSARLTRNGRRNADG
jgi:hypothetical protein